MALTTRSQLREAGKDFKDRKVPKLKNQALDSYAKQRPRLGRAAQFAVPAAILANLSGKKSVAAPITAAAAAAGYGDKVLQETAQASRSKRMKNMAKAFNKEGAVAVEPPFTTSMSDAHIRNVNQVTDELFANKAKMHQAAEKQLNALFDTPSTGRVRSVGMSAAEASALVNRAYK